MVEEFIPIFGILFGIGGPAVIVIVWFTLNYYKRRKLMELHHTERMAAIERGMEIPPLPIELRADEIGLFEAMPRQENDGAPDH